MKPIRPIVKYHGGKGRLFRWIVPLIPEHRIYCEPFGGAASVLLNKPRAEWEVYNDIEPTIYLLLKIVRDKMPELMERLSCIKYEKEVYQTHRDIYFSSTFNELPEVDRAVVTYVVKRMSRGGLCGTFCWSKRIYSTGPAEVHCWNSALDNIRSISERLRGVVIAKMDGLELIKKMDSPETAFYLDPPYLHETRFSPDLYLCEMNEAQHRNLLELVKSLKAKVLLSGYPSELYDTELVNWNRVTKDTANHSSHEPGKDRMTECIWMNF